jgi:hypothetical protein
MMQLTTDQQLILLNSSRATRPLTPDRIIQGFQLSGCQRRSDILLRFLNDLNHLLNLIRR